MKVYNFKMKHTCALAIFVASFMTCLILGNSTLLEICLTSLNNNISNSPSYLRLATGMRFVEIAQHVFLGLILFMLFCEYRINKKNKNPFIAIWCYLFLEESIKIKINIGEPFIRFISQNITHDFPILSEALKSPPLLNSIWIFTILTSFISFLAINKLNQKSKWNKASIEMNIYLLMSLFIFGFVFDSIAKMLNPNSYSYWCMQSVEEYGELSTIITAMLYYMKITLSELKKAKKPYSSLKQL